MGLMTYYIGERGFDPMEPRRITQAELDRKRYEFEKAMEDFKKAALKEQVQGAKVQKAMRDKAIFGPKKARWK